MKVSVRLDCWRLPNLAWEILGGTCYAGDQHVGQGGCLRSQILGGILGRFYSTGKVKRVSKVLKVQ